MSPILIIGSGLAGYGIAREIRHHDKTTPIVLLTADDGHSYAKPMLSKALADGKQPDALARFSAEQMAAQLAIQVRSHSRVTAIAPASHTVSVGDESLSYGKLVLALGADPIRLPIAGDAAEQILSVNDLADYTRFRAALEGKRRVAILGAGLIGCEFANDLLSIGAEVTVYDLAPQPLGRLLPTGAGGYLRDALAAKGVVWRLGHSVARAEPAAGGLALTADDGSVAEFDVVLSAVGLRPRIQLAQAAGLKVNRGIVVDRRLTTSDPDIYALGDCAEVAGLVLPYVQPIMEGSRALGAILAGQDKQVRYPAMPVAVKTSLCPTVVCPPPMAAAGAWQESISAGGVKALFVDPDGQPLGFALVGEAVKEKQALAATLPGWLG